MKSNETRADKKRDEENVKREVRERDKRKK